MEQSALRKYLNSELGEEFCDSQIYQALEGLLDIGFIIKGQNGLEWPCVDVKTTLQNVFDNEELNHEEVKGYLMIRKRKVRL